MKSQEIIELIQLHMEELRALFLVRELLLFGSAARNEATDSSDIDLIVDFEGPSTFDRFMGLKFYLEDLLGKKVDLVTLKALRPAIKQAIEREVIHVA